MFINPPLNQRGLWSLDELSPSDARTLLATARALKRAKGRGLPLQGKHVAVLCERPPGAAADVFSAAARGLGAQVTRIRPSASRLTESGDMQNTARILGRLYDAIECDDMGQAFMRELARAVAVPVSNVLVCDRHPIRMLADLMTMQEISAAPIDKLTMCVVGDERAPWSIAWRQFAALTGIGVRAGAPRQPTEAAEHSNHGGRAFVFVCDPEGPCCADDQPALLMLGPDGANGISLASRQVANHRFVVQALLAHTIT